MTDEKKVTETSEHSTYLIQSSHKFAFLNHHQSSLTLQFRTRFRMIGLIYRLIKLRGSNIAFQLSS